MLEIKMSRFDAEVIYNILEAFVNEFEGNEYVTVRFALNKVTSLINEALSTAGDN